MITEKSRATHPLLILAAFSFLAGCSTSPTPPMAPATVNAAPPPVMVDDSFATHVDPALPVIPDHAFKLTDFGAVGDGQTLNTDAFRQAIAAVAQAGGGTLVIPKGVFRTLPFTLCSNLDLHLDAGAVIQAPDTFAGYGLPDPASFHSQDEVAAKVTFPAPLISGNKLHDLAITGPGTIDGSGAPWWAWHGREARKHPGRVAYRPSSLVVISGCQRLHVADVTLANSPHFHLVAKDITDLLVERVKTRAPATSPNTDGIDIGPGTNFLVRDCDCSDGDDDICIKDGGTNILIENCTIHRGHGISIGSGTVAGVRNMLVRHCNFDGTAHALRIKSMRGAGGEVSNVHFTDIQIKNVTDFIWIISDYVDSNRPNFQGDPKLIPIFHDVLFDHITTENVKNAGRIVGLADCPIRGVTLRDVTINVEKPFEIKDAVGLAFDNVAINIKPSAAP
jgi:polygalacturonase